MDILKKIEEISKKGYAIEYTVVDQYQNGYEEEIKKGLMPPTTYTVYVIRLEDGESIYEESFNHIEDSLKAGITYVKKILKW
ncbi:TPA: hypothetical protein ACXDAY_002139 [Clostridium botulinum]|uniref:hypothetical protein n=1 Tax=Clostridium botulinum TaxID=1491 RepID=UPI00046583EF|nr:hypothetical protein [Clostridium botulinum]APH21058.1 hypothetical protein NPD1_4231 [Clostridium botulinum]APQ71127.1 hypothetical protein RSJ8_4188 [Clostridium botulinum]APR02583.1 hypothetical protein RSJ2_4049 [Clostridium botulinum]AUN01569.1 hypothetical protein RSJ19_00880 [Clostridium botulinum]MBN3359287.1 hypothetical protein [Clostridium botulinum]